MEKDLIDRLRNNMIGNTRFEAADLLESQAHRLEECEKALLAVANAKRFDRTIFEDDSAFVGWAQSLCRGAALATQQKNDQAESTTETTNAS